MSRSGWAGLALLTLSAGAWAANAELSPLDFAYGMPIATPTPGAAYRVAIPLEVYRKVVHEDLRDLRVFNARGEVVPYEFQQPQSKPVLRPPEQQLPVFALRGDARAALEGVRVTIQSLGAAVNVQAGAIASMGTWLRPARIHSSARSPLPAY